MNAFKPFRHGQRGRALLLEKMGWRILAATATNLDYNRYISYYRNNSWEISMLLELKTVTSTEFQTRAGLYMDQAAKEPVVITKHRRPVRVLIDFDEYERLKSYDTREAIYPHELSDELAAELETTTMDRRHSQLDKLMD
jgi:prevent-host-death family protein